LVRALVVGDLHINPDAALHGFDYEATVGADVVLQVGDLGFWPWPAFGRKFFRKVEARLASHGLNLWWSDGNHDDLLAHGTRPSRLTGVVGCQST
jgi:hypothetical protein